MSRAVADNFILSAVDLPDLPLPPIDTRESTRFPPSSRLESLSSPSTSLPSPISLRRLGHISV